MKKEIFFNAMPTQVINAEDVSTELEKQKGLVEAGNSFVSQLSINRYLYKKLTEFDLTERLELFSELMNADFVITENELFFSDIDTDSFAAILEEQFKLDSMYELDNLYIERLLAGQDISSEEVEIFGEKMRFADMLQTLVFQTGGMSMGDTPTVSMMLVVKKALLGAYLAEQNVNSLSEGKNEIYDISVLI